jgi:hypothetical protein
MILDLQTKFSDAQAVTVTAISTNVLDLRNAATPALVDEGMSGPETWLVIHVPTAFTAGGAATMTITLESDSTANLATAPVVHFTSPAIPVASLVAGYNAIRVQLPSADYKRYLGIRYTIATGPMTAGAINAFLTPDLQRNVIYPVGFSVA